MTRHLVPVSIYLSLLLSCNSPKEYKSFDEYPSYEGDDLELFYSPTKSVFTLWAPTAFAQIPGVSSSHLSPIRIWKV